MKAEPRLWAGFSEAVQEDTFPSGAAQTENSDAPKMRDVYQAWHPGGIYCSVVTARCHLDTQDKEEGWWKWKRRDRKEHCCHQLMLAGCRSFTFDSNCHTVDKPKTVLRGKHLNPITVNISNPLLVISLFTCSDSRHAFCAVICVLGGIETMFFFFNSQKKDIFPFESG